MADPNDFDARAQRHIDISATREAADYAYPSRPIARRPRRADYRAHADALREQLISALGAIPPAAQDRRENIPGLKRGAIVQIETMPPAERARITAVKIPNSLEFANQDIVVLKSVRTESRNERALLFVPDDARGFLDQRLDAYGNPVAPEVQRPDIDRFEIIEAIRTADADALFEQQGAAPAAAVWWELWIRGDLVDGVAAAARRSELQLHADRLSFPETSVVFVHGLAGPVRDFVSRCAGAVYEVRRATGDVSVFLEREERGVGPVDWVAELAARVVPPPEGAPKVCTLDTGVAADHPLLKPGLAPPLAYDNAWGTDDHHPDGGHGTGMAGLALYGDLDTPLNGGGRVELTHSVVSMKLLPPAGFPPHKPPSYGIVTQGAVALVEIAHPSPPTYCLATSTDEFSPGRPSSWSGALDQACAGAMPGDPNGQGVAAAAKPKRLVLVAAGNVLDGHRTDVMVDKSIEDPAQSWNALTIGGYTTKEKAPAGPPRLLPLVQANHRSPYSTVSHQLPPDITPIKPEVMFEAGNMLVDASDFCGWNPSVSLLTTGSDFLTTPLTPFWATSAATGCAGKFMGALEAALPGLWPETYRALAVQSAEWPAPLRQQLVGRGAHWKSGPKAQKLQVVRTVGFGVPQLDRAIMSAKNDMTLIAQSEIQPFQLAPAGNAIFNEMHFYDLPWPKAALEKIANDIVTMKVTLSYFIEPNLTGKAATRPDTYRSFGLRFSMKKRGETEKQFRRRINRAEEAPATRQEDPEADYWLLGTNAQQAGSLHCDLWRGRAIDLALHDAIAIYPVGGWWKSHLGQRRATDRGRYSLLVSISAPGSVVDLHSEAAALIAAKEAEIAAAAVAVDV